MTQPKFTVTFSINDDDQEIYEGDKSYDDQVKDIRNNLELCLEEQNYTLVDPIKIEVTE